MSAYASVEDVAVRYGQAITSPGQVLVWLGDAEADIAAEFAAAGRDLAGEVAASPVMADAVNRVECELAIARLANPHGAANAVQQETVGPFARQQTTTFGNAAGGAGGLTDRHRRWLRLPAEGAFTVRPGGVR